MAPDPEDSDEPDAEDSDEPEYQTIPNNPAIIEKPSNSDFQDYMKSTTAIFGGVKSLKRSVDRIQEQPELLTPRF